MVAIGIVTSLLVSACGGSYPTRTNPPSPTFGAAPTTGATQPRATFGAAATATAPRATSAPAPTFGSAGSAGSQGPSGPQGPIGYIPLPGRDGTIGLATGGAKDISNFRENIRNGYLPQPTDVTYEGLFYDYYFDTGASEPTDKLFSPSYSYAVTRDPLAGKTDYYLGVGLNSGLKESDFQRRKLNLAIVLDNSGSMGESFNRYYYDSAGKSRDVYAEEGASNLRKMDSADRSVTYILDQLTGDDRLSMVTFNSTASVLKSMGPVRNANMREVRDRVLQINPGGGTNLSAGIAAGTDQLRNFAEVGGTYENRMIILTDAEPNSGEFGAGGLGGMLARNAKSGIYTTFIGIGVDFNSDLIEQISKVKGANYYSVHSPSEFRERVQDEFDFMVTPVVFDVELRFRSAGWKIEKVFGSPEADQASGQLMRINTLFPSKSVSGENKGGLVLLKLRKTSSNPADKVTLEVTYEDRNGRQDRSIKEISFDAEQPDFYGNDGIRKGILLTRYASLLQNWMLDQRQNLRAGQTWKARVDERNGIVIQDFAKVGQWERQSLPLAVSEDYRRLFDSFSLYFAAEMKATGDDTLSQELAILRTLRR